MQTIKYYQIPNCMKRILLLSMAVLFFASCGSDKSSEKQGNPYIGRIPELQVEEYEASEAFDQSKANTSWYYSDEKQEFDKMIAAELSSLQGVRMPCVSGQPDIFSVLGDVAVFKDGSYHALLCFNRAVSLYFDVPYTVSFTNAAENQSYGEETQILFSRYFLEDGWHRVRVSSYFPGDCRLVNFYINTIRFEDATELQQKMDLAVLTLKSDDVRSLDVHAEREYYFPENMAIEIQEAFYKAIVNDDMEAYDGVDYGFGEMDCFEDEDTASYFNQTYDLWKSIFPEKWQVIKDFRAKKIKEGYALCILDTEDPE